MLSSLLLSAAFGGGEEAAVGEEMAYPRADALRYTHTAPLGLTRSLHVTCMHTLFNAHSLINIVGHGLHPLFL